MHKEVIDLLLFNGTVVQSIDPIQAMALIKSLPSSWHQMCNVMVLQDSTNPNYIIQMLKQNIELNEPDNGLGGETVYSAKLGKKGKGINILKCKNYFKTGHMCNQY